VPGSNNHVLPSHAKKKSEKRKNQIRPEKREKVKKETNKTGKRKETRKKVRKK
jgi:hypothetical protein